MSKKLFQKKDNFLKLISIIIFSGFSFITINLLTINRNVLISSLYEELMVYDLGFSSLGNLVDKDGLGSEKISMYIKFKNLVKTLIRFPFNTYKNEVDPIPTIEISIPYENLNLIYKDRLNAINKGFLKNETWTSGTINYGDKEISARIRLKGILSSHWEADKRFSLRIKLKKNKSNKQKDYILGMNSFSLHKLRSRQYPYENIFQEILPQIGLSSVTHKIVKIKLNGIDWGYMDMQENFNNILLEKNSLKDSLILSFNDEIYWAEYSKETKFPLKRSEYWLSHPRLFIDLSGKSIKRLNDQERLYFGYILKNLQDDNYQEILFSDSHLNTAREMVRVWGNYHAISSGNAKFYFNPFTLKLEPLMSDQGPFKYISQNIDTLDDNYQGLLKTKIIKKPSQTQNQLLRSKIINLINSKSPYETSQKLFPFDLKLNTKVPNMNYSYLNKNSDENITNKKNYYYGDEIICKDDRYQLRTDFDAIKANYDGNKIYIYNLLCGEIKINKINLCGISFTSNIIIDKDRIKLNKPYVIEKSFLYKNLKKENESLKNNYINPFNKCNTEDNNIDYLFNKKDYTANIKKINYVEKNKNPLLHNKNYKFFDQISNNNFILRKDTYEIKKPVFLKGNLTIEEGTNLKFSKNAYLIVKGNINIKGLKDQPVIMTSADENETWKGIYVYNEEVSKKGKSYIKNLKISNITELDDGILNLSGGMNFYNLDLIIGNLKITNSKAEDSLNIVKSFVEIKDLYIKDTKSDAFDCDFCDGSISNFNLNKIGGDGLDLSGSSIIASISNAHNVKDKVVSVGERSTINLDLKKVSNSYVAVAVKDASSADIIMEDINTLGPKVMSYIKKPFYLGKTNVKIKYKNSGQILNLDNNFLASNETNMFVNSKKIKTKSLNVEALYQSGPMKKN